MRKMTLLALLLALMCGCAAKHIHPGAINQADSDIYDTLLVSQAAIEQAKTDVVSYPAAKPILNEAIAAYDTAETAYIAYHDGKSADLVGLQIQVAALLKDIAQVQTAFGKKAGK